MLRQRKSSTFIGVLIFLLIPIFQIPASAAPCTATPTTFTGDGSNGTLGVVYNFVEFKTIGTCEWNAPTSIVADFLIVGGGGGGGFGSNGGGGGAGQVVTNNSALQIFSGTQISITIGGGGSGGWNATQANWTKGTNGNPSSIIVNGVTINAIGGGGGGGNTGSAGMNGGSGGGGSGTSANSETLNGGSGSTSTILSWTARGNNGGTGGSGRGAGGGGAGTVGGNGGAVVGAGGDGVTIFGKSVGGGGGGWTNTATNSFGGGYGGSSTASISCTPSCHGTVNTGGGGGGGGNGGSGYIAVRYLNDTTAPTFTSSTSFSVAENVSTLTNAATIKVSESATVTISSGADAARFNIITSDSVTAFIRFKVSPDFEAPTDFGGNNVYDLTLTATDGASNAGTQSINITVTDVVDTSSFNTLTLSGAASFRQVVTITANLSTASRVTFRARNIIISGCKNILTTGSSPNIIATCNWRPSTRGAVTLTATSVPTNVAISGAAATPILVSVSNRSSGRS